MIFGAWEIEWFSRFVREIYAARTPAEFSRAALATFGHRFELIISAVEELGHGGSSYALHGMTHSAPLPANHIAYIHDHPTLPRVNCLRPIEHVRGTVSRAELERTDYFNCIARPMGYKDHLIVRAQGAPTAVTLSLCRDRLFTPAETELLRMMQPHLTAAWRRASDPHFMPGEISAQRLMVSAGLRPVGMTPAQFERLRTYFVAWRDPNRLPIPLFDWVATSREEFRQGPRARPLRVFAIESAQGTLYFRYFPGEGDSAELRMMERPNAQRSRTFVSGLSLRECEVLHWIGQGKRDAEIGVILGVSARTVGKHVEHLLAKLGAANRTAAAAIAGTT